MSQRIKRYHQSLIKFNVFLRRYMHSNDTKFRDQDSGGAATYSNRTVMSNALSQKYPLIPIITPFNSLKYNLRASKILIFLRSMYNYCLYLQDLNLTPLLTGLHHFL